MAGMSEDQRGLLYLFEQPSRAIAFPRAAGSVVYDMPPEQMPPGMELAPRSGPSPGRTVVTVSPVDNLKDELGSALSIPKGAVFSVFLKQHRQAAKDLIACFLKRRSPAELRNVAANVHDMVNESLFVYSLSFVIIRRSDLRNVRLPPIYETFPSWFVPETTIAKAREEVSKQRYMPKTERIVVDHGLEFSGTDENPEHRVAYWREDYGINAHHWHWHIVFPAEIEIALHRDRKGELFYYMHQQMMARYDMERMSVGLGRVVKLDNWREPIPEGYFPKLTTGNSSLNWGSRPDGLSVKNLTRHRIRININEMEMWRDRIFEAIHLKKVVQEDGKEIQLTDDLDPDRGQKRGIDIVGDMLEADTRLSPNYTFYGDMHNFGHVLLALAHDPDGVHREEMGVMGDSGTAMRDPVFYRWHRYIDDIFQEYKFLQKPYTEDQLNFPEVSVDKVTVTAGLENNVLYTYFNMREIEASRGLDFDSDTPVIVRLTHLDHRPFKYHFQISNKSRSKVEATIRVFIAPMLNIRNMRMNFLEQRTLFAEMDKFQISLKPGKNIIERRDDESSITLPREFNFRNIERGEVYEDGTVAPPESDGSFCACGWPQHVLLPRGKPEGMPFQLVVMVTDWNEDKVNQPTPRACGNAASFCGILNGKYPDKKPMGFPFDRLPSDHPTNGPWMVEEYLGRFSNVSVTEINIKFSKKKIAEE
ncbi:phenoloxidase 1-like [Oratosquilla oratoria]|uniref:phenoloxidase 1-like n=1 Tax=Oratosquilla oratoria TaxID=337810 RepID=UPI003F76E07B